jgi:hypothetical protein
MTLTNINQGLVPIYNRKEWRTFYWYIGRMLRILVVVEPLRIEDFDAAGSVNYKDDESLKLREQHH